MIPTLTGQLKAGDLGATLMHEHIFVLNAELVVNYPNRLDSDQLIKRAVSYLQEVKDSGIDTIVDLTVMGTGRNIPLVQRVAERTDINIIVATGWYTYHDAPNFIMLNGPGRLLGGEDIFAQMLIDDIREGIGGTGIKAGALKFATDHYGMTDGVRYIMQAVVDAHLETGTPIFTHSDPSQENGLDQQDYLEQRSVDLTRVVIGHSGDTADINYLRKIADRGSMLGMDRFGLESKLPYEQRIETVVEMCRLGYAPQMVLATDSSAYSMNFPDAAREARLPKWNAKEIMNSVVPDLKACGVSDDDIHTMMKDNAVKILDAVSARSGNHD